MGGLLENTTPVIKQNDPDIPEYLETVYDKIYRSSSGKKVFYNLELSQFFVSNW